MKKFCCGFAFSFFVVAAYYTFDVAAILIHGLVFG